MNPAERFVSPLAILIVSPPAHCKHIGLSHLTHHRSRRRFFDFSNWLAEFLIAPWWFRTHPLLNPNLCPTGADPGQETDHQFLNPNLAPQPLIRHQATNATAAIVVHGNRRALGKIVYICLYDLAAVAPFGREAANCAEVMRAE